MLNKNDRYVLVASHSNLLIVVSKTSTADDPMSRDYGALIYINTTGIYPFV